MNETRGDAKRQNFFHQKIDGLCTILFINTLYKQLLSCVFELVHLPPRNVNLLLMLLTHNTAVIGL
jgi:hypothetical protein